jgi:hypothetical protein
MAAGNSVCPSDWTLKVTVWPVRARSDSPSETLKRRRSRLVSTMVASTFPDWMYCPVSIDRVLITPPRGARTRERCTFWAAMSRVARAESASACSRSASPCARLISSADTSCSRASASRRASSPFARSASATAFL